MMGAPIKEEALALYRLLCRARSLQESLIIAKSKGLFPGPLLTALGQEGTIVGSLFAYLKRGFFSKAPINPDHRVMFAVAVMADEALHTDYFTKDMLRNFFCRRTGGHKGRDGNVHIGWPHYMILPFMSSDMGRMTGVTQGFMEEVSRHISWDTTPESERPVAITYFGDSAAQQGAVHEAMNLAAVRRTPIIFAINNNRVALFTKPEEIHGGVKLFRRALGYKNMLGVQVDGTDAWAAYQATQKAIAYAQKERAPALIEFLNYRFTAHNEAQISRAKGALSRRALYEIDKIFGLCDEELTELKKAMKHDPLRRAQCFMVERGFLFGDVGAEPIHDEVIDEERARIDTLVEEILQEPKITRAEDAEDRSIFPAFPQAISSVPKCSTKFLRYNESFTHSVEVLMAEDDRTVYFGEDVAAPEGGVLGLTKGLCKQFDNSRLYNTPISEEAFAASAIGRALAGGKPICEFQFAHFFADAFPVLLAISPQWYQKKYCLGATFILPSGIVHEGASGHYHESWVERKLPRGVVVVAPANAYEVVGLMRAAHEYNGPIAVLLQISAAGMDDFRSEVPLQPYSIQIGKAHVEQEGADCTVVTYGAACVAAVRNEAGYLSQEGIFLEVINLRTVHPYDRDTVTRSIEKTGRLILMHEDYEHGGIGDRILGDLAKHGALKSICAPHVPVLGATHPFISTDLDLVWDSLPYERVKVKREGEKGEFVQTIHRSSRLAKLVRELMEYKAQRRRL